MKLFHAISCELYTNYIFFVVVQLHCGNILTCDLLWSIPVFAMLFYVLILFSEKVWLHASGTIVLSFRKLKNGRSFLTVSPHFNHKYQWCSHGTRDNRSCCRDILRFRKDKIMSLYYGIYSRTKVCKTNRFLSDKSIFLTFCRMKTHQHHYTAVEVTLNDI